MFKGSIFTLLALAIGYVSGQGCTTGDARLFGGSTSTEGTVEVCDNGLWYLICDEGWSQLEAQVVCASLGYSNLSANAYGLSLFGSSGQTVQFSNYQCSGYEDDLGACTKSTTLPSTCSKSTLAGVKCSQIGTCEGAGFDSCCTSGCLVGGCYCDSSCYFFGDCCYDDISTTCPQGCTGNDLRIVDGFYNDNSDGRVEVCVNGEWSAVCDSQWGINDASVMCSQAGYSGATPIVYSGSYPFGQGDQALLVGGFQCLGTEATWDACTYATTTCGHHEEAHVDCNGPCTSDTIRLVNSSGTGGRVQYCSNQQWGSIGGQGWSQNDAKVTCLQLGYSQYNYHAYTSVDQFGPALFNEVLTSVICTGSENSLADCPNTASSSTPGNTVASVQCAAQYTCEAAGFTSCCISGCNPGGGSCYCDSPCHSFGDCCEGIEYTCPDSGGACTNGDLRLDDGTSSYNGRVDVCVNQQWGSICDNNWDNSDAVVVCTQLTYSTTGASAVTGSYFPPGTDNIVASNFGCTGTETQLTSCAYTSSGDCSHQQEAGVFCSEPCTTEGDVRLVNGTDTFGGRVEVCVSGFWGTICQGFWSLEDATVVCRQLNYSEIGVKAYGNAYYGEGHNLIHWTDLQCTGSESGLSSCTKSTSPTCTHSMDVAVQCNPNGTCQQAGHTTCCTVAPCFTPQGCYCDTSCYFFGDCCYDDIDLICPQAGTEDCTDGDIRLIGANSDSMGTVEHCISGEWTTICDNGWTTEDAQVVCAQLGQPSAGAIAVSGAAFGQGSGTVGGENYTCTGTETSLSLCTSATSTSQCSHVQDAGVICSAFCPTEGEVRLFGGSVESEGRVEVCKNSIWVTICDTNWCEVDAKVVCRQLGYSDNRVDPYGGSYFGQTVVQPGYTNVGCLGTEASLADCPKMDTTGSLFTCNYANVASVKCYEQSVCETELSQTTCCTSNCNTGGCYCDAACYFFQDCCPGVENTCPTPCTDGVTRLVNGTDMFEGRAEVCIDGAWGAVCDSNWDANDATVFCSQTGLPSSNVVAFSDSSFGPGNVPLKGTNFQCTGGEASITDCTYTPVDSDNCCSHSDEAGVRCNPECSYGDVRLVDGSSDLEGRVEMCYNGQYATVCDDSWSNYDASVLCASLGYSYITAQAYGGAHFGEGTGTVIGYGDVVCNGTEGSLFDCSYTLLPSECTHAQDASVICTPLGTCELNGHTECCTTGCNTGSCYCDPLCHFFDDCCSDIIYTCPQSTCINGEIRLDNNGLDFPYAGRVELCINGQWGTVCSDYWDDKEAGVVCQQVGFTQYSSFAVNSSLFGPGIGLDIVASNFSCTGSESSIYNCPYSTDADCGHHQDAAVLCNVPCTDGDIRLVNGTTDFNGQVEICYNKSYHAICDNGWSTEDAMVTCARVGYSVAKAQAYGSSVYGAGFIPPILDNVNCTGMENSLLECQYDMAGPATCLPDSYAGVDCQGAVLSGGCEEDRHFTCCSSGCFTGFCWCDAICHAFGDCCDDIDLTCPQDVCNSGDVRVDDGDTIYSGRAEVCVDGQFGTICDENWDDNDALVFCKQLTGGAANGAVAVSGATFGQETTLDIVLSNVGCSGFQNSILDCPHDPNPSCGHHQDAGVFCPEPCYLLGDIRLVNGSSTSQGRIEVCINGVWSSVCADETVCEDVGKLACAYLGFSPLRADVLGLAIYGQSPGPVGIENIACPADATNLTDCTFTSPSTCSHSMDAGLNCYPNTPCALAGHTSCCTSGCFIGGCWCDYLCHFFQDCCEDIEVTCPSGGGSSPSNINDGCSGTETRLLYGNDTSGIAQTCVDGKFSSVCSTGFGSEEAAIFCRGLGYDDEDFTIVPTTVYGQALGNVYQKNLQCDGDELALTDCDGDDICCGHQFDTGLVCKPACEDGDIRLAGGTTDMEGRVEVCESGRWGTVCDDLWDYKDARVACKQAGLPWKGAVAWSSSYFGNGIGPILLDNVQCDGSEGTLFNCSAITNHNCGHHEDAGVTCAPGPCELAGYIDTCCDPTGATDCQGVDSQDICHCSYDCHEHDDCCLDADFICSCNEGDLRLADGTNEMEGRVEICLDSQWGTVCDDFWGVADARVVCRQLGFPSAGAEAFNFAYFGQGTGPIQLDNVQCDGTEDYLLNCSLLYTHNCGHYEDASVRCNPEECVHGGIQLTGGTTNTAGQLEVCAEGVWGTVCDDFWDQMNSEVACKQLGLPSEGALEVNSYQYFGFGSGPINMDNVMCIGNETSLFDCDYLSNHNCGHFEDVGLVCLETCSTDGEVRLVGGKYDNEGRVEICKNQQWTTICDDNWDNLDAAVACRSAGLPSEGARALVNLQFGLGWGDISYTNFGCTGSESNLTECSASTSTPFCSHYDDAGVQCPGPCVEGDIRLVDGNSNSTDGRVEVCRNTTWGTICDNTNSWSTADAMVVCRQLQLPFTAAQSESFGPGADPIHYADMGCTGQEQSLVSCDKDLTPTTCTHLDDVGVICEDACPLGAVTLVDGNVPQNGRVEVCLGGKWGTVCDHEWDHQDCQTICKQLGFPYEGAEAKYDAYFGQGDAHIAVSEVHCDTTAEQFSECLYSTGTDVSCSHADDASCLCQDLCENGAVRLSEGNVPTEGRVEVCFNGEWGTVCDNSWTGPDGEVVCRQLGYPTYDIRVFGSSKFGAGIGPIYYTNVQCTGTESALHFCPLSTNTDSCEHSEDVGLRCPNIAPTGTTSATVVVPSTTPTAKPKCPSEVLNLNCTITDTQAVVHWDEPAVPNGVITGYEVDFAGDNFYDQELLGNQARQVVLPVPGTGVPITTTVIPSNLFCAGPSVTSTCFYNESCPMVGPKVSGSRQNEYTMVINWPALTPTQARGHIVSYTMQFGPYDGTYTQVTRTQLVYLEDLPITISSLDITQRYYVRAFGTTAVCNGTYSSPTIVPTTDTALFQLKLALIEGQTCADYVLDNSNAKVEDIIRSVASEVTSRCRGCTFGTDHISEGVLQCDPDDEDQVTFRARLYAVGNMQSSTFIGYISDWVTDSSNTPVLTVQNVNLEVDPDCVVNITSFDDPLCGSRSSLALSSAATASIIVVVVVVVMVVVLIVVIIIVRRTRTKYQANNYTDHEMVGYSNRMAFPEGEDGDNISQKMGSTVHDDDFQEAINIISTDIEQMHGDDDKARLAAEFGDN